MRVNPIVLKLNFELEQQKHIDAAALHLKRMQDYPVSLVDNYDEIRPIVRELASISFNKAVVALMKAADLDEKDATQLVYHCLNNR